MRIANEQSWWRWIVLAGLGLASTSVMCSREYEREAAVRPTTPIHIKYRAGMVRAAAIGGARAEPLFTSVRMSRVGVDDDRARWVRIEVARERAQAVLAKLQQDRNIEQAFVPPTVTLPTSEWPEHEMTLLTEREPRGNGDVACPIKTPSFESYQGYLGPAPEGIDAPAAWRRGVTGQGVWFADIEGGWNAAHEDLPGDRISHVAGQPIDDRHWRMHGTAVLGEVVGLDNGKGVVGIAPDVERVFTSSIGGIAVADAIDAAAEALRPGDVLLIELQGGGPRGRYLPIEFWDDNYDAIAAATRRGVIVIEAAGNGAENLDHREYGGKLSRKGRDSGAIMIGAGGPARDGFSDRERLDFSNWGTRVDVQGWGRMVATLDYGDLQACNDAGDRHYTNQFSGTSSASPIVAGAAILVQSLAKQQGRVVTPIVMRELLRATGTPQTGNTREAIGPRPDLARALERL